MAGPDVPSEPPSDVRTEPGSGSAIPLDAVCECVSFDPGEMLRRKGEFYISAYLISDGVAEVELDGRTVALGPGSPVGEIGFVKGVAATANVRARTRLEAYVIDETALDRLEHADPAGAVRLRQDLAAAASSRLEANVLIEPKSGPEPAVELVVCRDKATLDRARRLRYDVYCGELGRRSPHADHRQRLLGDELDEKAVVMLAVSDGEPVGTVRANRPSDFADVDAVGALFGMLESPHFPQRTSITSKFIVRREWRKTPLAMRLVSALTSLGLREGFQESYMDSIPALVPYYRALGYKVSGRKFVHPENGASWPMRVDLIRRGGFLAKPKSSADLAWIYLLARMYRLLSREA